VWQCVLEQHLKLGYQVVYKQLLLQRYQIGSRQQLMKRSAASQRVNALHGKGMGHIFRMSAGFSTYAVSGQHEGSSTAHKALTTAGMAFTTKSTDVQPHGI